MKAHVGDRIVVAPRTSGRPIRDAEIIELRTEDGSPPYLVRWSDTGRTGLWFPGGDAHLSEVHEPPPAEQPAAAAAATSGAAADLPHVRTWRVNIDLFESTDDTVAHAVLVTEAPRHLDAHGEAHRADPDPAVPEIGDELAVARALRRLSERLMQTASEDLSALEQDHTPVSG